MATSAPSSTSTSSTVWIRNLSPVRISHLFLSNHTSNPSLQVLVGSYFSVAGAFVGVLKPERMSVFGSLLVIWGLVKEGIPGKPANTDPSKSAYVYPTMVVAVICAFSLVNYDVKKAVRSAPVRPIAKPLQSSSKSKLKYSLQHYQTFPASVKLHLFWFNCMDHREEFLSGDPVWFRLVYNIETNQFKMELCGRPNTNENNSQAEIENETGTSDLVVLSINRILQQAVSSGSSDGTIYKVPEPLRSIKPEAYTPTVISIGPLHSGRKDLMANSLKPRYLQNFLNLTQLPTNTIVEIVKTWEKRARYCYAESIEMSRDEFVELLVFDGCFVVMHLISYSFFELRASDMSNLWKFWDELFCDLILLENQLPFFLLQSLYDLCASSQPFSKGVRFIELVHQYFIESHKGGLFSLKEHVLLAGIGVQVNHFVDLLRLHFTHTRSDKMSFQHTFWPPNATQLHECGVIFKTGKGIAFKDQGGCLQLPQINIYDDFEKRVRNLIAYEQCHFCSELRNEVSNFAVFMQCLVQTDQDVKLLIEGGIIHNNFGSINEVTQLFNNLGKHICPGINSYNSDCKRMKDYCKRPCHRWISLLRHNYFSTPWLCASSIAAILLLALTLIQTIVALVDLLFK